MNLIALCASHINCKERLHALQVMINSIKNQTFQISLYISISCDDELKINIDNIINLYKNELIHFIFHEGKLSQFEHYFELCKYYDLNKNDIWCIFCDDDDFSHPLRSISYKNAINTTNLNHQSVYFHEYELQVDSDIYDLNESIDANYNLNSLNKKLNDTSAKITEGGQDYFMFASRINVLYFFFQIFKKNILLNTGCDLIWRNLQRCLPCKIIKNTDSLWLYAHKRSIALSPSTLYVDYEKLSQIWNIEKLFICFCWKSVNTLIEIDPSMKSYIYDCYNKII